MSDPTITCPSCKTEIKLTESLAAPLLASTRQLYEQRLADKDTETAGKIEAERRRISQEEAKKARLLLSSDLEQKTKELADLQEVLKAREEKLAEAQKAQADLIRQKRELDDAKRELDLTVEKKVQESLSSIREKAKQEAEEGLQLKVAEKEEIIAGMQRQIEELKRKSERGSEQLYGEVLELELENVLRAAFPQDTITPVPKGEYGGDLVQVVLNPLGQPCGTILWESKRTKNWSDGWLPKLRDDQRAAKAEVALIVSQVLPNDVDTFSLIDGVWVTGYRCAIPVATAIRQSLIELAAARKAGEGQQTKMEMVYQYLTGPRFRLRIHAIVEKFTEMQEDLEKERKTLTRLWAKRGQQIQGVIESTAGMYGDLQGIAGKTLLEIDGLGIPLLDAPDADLPAKRISQAEKDKGSDGS